MKTHRRARGGDAGARAEAEATAAGLPGADPDHYEELETTALLEWEREQRAREAALEEDELDEEEEEDEARRQRAGTA